MAQMKTVNEGTVGVVSADGFGRAVTKLVGYTLQRHLSQPEEWVRTTTCYEFEDGSEAVRVAAGEYLDPATGEIFKA